MLLLAIAGLNGCGGVRFVIDAVPVNDRLTETPVLDVRAPRSTKIAMIDVDGLIADADRGGLLRAGENPVSLFVESLDKAEHDTNVQAIIVRINSPGGTVTASDIMYRELTSFRARSGKPAIVLMGDVAASGGYYLACGGDEIIAHPTTITGSIGVIMQLVNFSDGMRRIGITADAVTSGPNKAMGSPFEPEEAAHRALFQEMVDEFYVSFRDVVESARPGIDPNDLDWLTDGRVVTGARAAEVGLVDSVGDLRDAFTAAKRHAGVERARLVKYHRPLRHVGSAYAATPAAPTPSADANTEVNLVQLNLDHGGPLRDQIGFYYLWMP